VSKRGSNYTERAGGPSPGLSDEDKRTLLRVARQTLHEYLSTGKFPQCQTDVPVLRLPGAAFVTLWRWDTRELRGCRGEYFADRPLIESVALMAIASAIDDPRFPPVRVNEVSRLLIEKGQHKGLLLPRVPVEWGWDRDRFLRELCCKAGLPENAWQAPDAQLYGFATEEWGEEE
jgi:AMMECR1 domain-containing protein